MGLRSMARIAYRLRELLNFLLQLRRNRLLVEQLLLRDPFFGRLGCFVHVLQGSTHTGEGEAATQMPLNIPNAQRSREPRCPTSAAALPRNHRENYLF